MKEDIDGVEDKGGKNKLPDTDIPRLMSEIRAKVEVELANQPRDSKPLKTYTAVQNKSGHRRAGELMHSEELHYLNAHWDHQPNPDLSQITSHRPGIIGRKIVAMKQNLLTLVYNFFLKDYFRAEREYQMRMVQYLNAVSLYVDDRDGATFWELVRKIDYDVSKAINRIERIADEQNGSLRSLERSVVDSMNGSLRQLNDRITELQALAQQSAGRLQTVESVTVGVERIVGRLTREVPGEPTTTTLPVETADHSYVMLENRYRGSEEEISERLKIYPEIFEKDKGPILEIGAGRGELQNLFATSGVPSYGIDMDSAMVAAAKDSGANVEYGDGLAILNNVPDRSLGGVIAIQVVEHLTRQQLAQLFDACTKKVKAGGRIVFETINPQSMLALSSNYFRDPTHVWPLHPDTLSFAMTMAGLKVVEVRKLSPVPDESLLKKVPVEEYMTPRWAHAVDTLNRNVDQLNELLFGFQDYAIVAEVL